MEKAFLTDFFYGDEAEQFTFFRIPRLLITSPHFSGISIEAMLKRRVYCGIHYHLWPNV